MNKNTTVKPLAQGHLLEILRMQVETNDTYDANWRDNNTLLQFKTAAGVERTEMLDEIEVLWKWYEPNPTWEPEKALFELVDTVHFAASCLLIGRPVGVEDKLKTFELSSHVYTGVDAFKEADDWWVSFTNSMGMGSIMVQPCESLCYYIGAMVSVLGYTHEQYMAAHYKKNQRNLERANGGVMVGSYDKSAEVPLEL
ncbi:nucleoside triphosphate pyrophosphohydrolase [Vibrio phage K469]